MSEKFKCDACGLCCKAINCEHLTEDNKCAIYETRPMICNVEKTYELVFKDVMTKQEFFKINEQACIDIKNGEK